MRKAKAKGKAKAKAKSKAKGKAKPKPKRKRKPMPKPKGKAKAKCRHLLEREFPGLVLHAKQVVGKSRQDAPIGNGFRGVEPSIWDGGIIGPKHCVCFARTTEPVGKEHNSAAVEDVLGVIFGQTKQRGSERCVGSQMGLDFVHLKSNHR